jgi:tripartite-type tricarboxylate transporter receptor subunit TctC
MTAASRSVALALLAAVSGPGTTAFAQQSVADFYHGKTITLVVATGAGNGIDLLARALAAYMGQHIPGNPNIIVRNMPGAGGMVGSQYLFNVAKRDGTEIGTIESGVIFAPFISTTATRLDMPKFGWLGSVSQDTAIAVVWTASGVKTIDDARSRVVVAGATAATQSAGQFPALANATIGTKFKTVFGYTGATQVDLAMERGEVDATLRTVTALRATHPDWVRDGKVRTILQMGPTKNPELADVPWLDELAGSDDDRALIRLVSTQFLLSRPYMTPPGLPPERLAALRAAFDATMRDPAFVEKATAYSNVRPVTGVEFEKALARIYATPENVIARLASLTNAQADLQRQQTKK